MYVMTNVLGLVVVLTTRNSTGATVEAVFVTFSYYAAVTRVMWEFNRIYRMLEASLTDAAQFADLLLDPPVVVDVPAPQAFAPRDFGLELDRVTFSYEPSLPKLFDHLSLAIPAGRKVGFVGRSGGGKTTLTRLLLRFMDPDDGEIRIGGLPIDQVPLAALRRAIAYVPQDPSMFHRSIADNIRFGRPEATDAEVRQAARMAHAAEFIEALPGGYDTIVGERGVKLSGGQRQRVAIARAILKGCADSRARRATVRSTPAGAHPGRALDADGGPHGDRDRTSALDRAPHGRTGGARPRPGHRTGRPRRTAGRPGRVRRALGAPVGRFPRRRGGRRRLR
jgi:ATP-binding cassette subfamily B protein